MGDYTNNKLHYFTKMAFVNDFQNQKNCVPDIY